MQITQVQRRFKYNSLVLDDPGESLSLEEVKDLYAASMYPELRTAVIEGPAMEADYLTYTFLRASRDKG
ncbi:MAG: PRTRC system protein C [Nevskiaceae bacterium]|nr:MAG: PRTRC system protein C [Nevskiaceae bacterium]